MQPRFSILFALALAVPLAACGDDPTGYSSPVGINLKAKSGDVQSGVISDEKGITTESGNPYGAFVTDARAALGGADPARIEVDSATLVLGASSTGVLTLGEVFGGTVEVLFIMNDTNNTFAVGTAAIDATTSAGPVALDIGFASDGVLGDDWTKLLGGSFKVVVRGPAAAGFTTKGADADLQTTFTFAAYE